MSGGHFEHKQYAITEIIEEMDEVLKNCDLAPDAKREYSEEEYYYDESGSLQGYVYDIPKFKSEVEKAKYHLKMAHTMVQRIDWYLSGDDGWDSFTERLEEELLKIEKR